MSSAIRGILEVSITNADFPKMKSNFEIYFDCTIGDKTQKSKSASGMNPLWEEKIALPFSNESSLTFKLYEKKLLLKDKILLNNRIDLSLLKESFKIEQNINYIKKNKVKGKFRLVLILYPYKIYLSDFSLTIDPSSVVSVSNTKNYEVSI